jgi:uncharacterized Fe-S center protein
MVISAPVLPNNRITDFHSNEHLEGIDKFCLVHPDTEWKKGLEYAEKIGLGTQEYELIPLLMHNR